MIRTTDEFLVFTLADRDDQDLSTDPVSVAIVTQGPVDDDTDWLPCTFVSSSTDANAKTTYRFRTSSTVDFSPDAFPGTYWVVYGRLSDSPETPVFIVGDFTLDD